jgi:hypothetical protein
LAGVRPNVAEAMYKYIPHGITRRMGRSPLLAVSTLCATLPVVHCPVFVISEVKTANGQGGSSEGPRRRSTVIPT